MQEEPNDVHIEADGGNAVVVHSEPELGMLAPHDELRVQHNEEGEQQDLKNKQKTRPLGPKDELRPKGQSAWTRNKKDNHGTRMPCAKDIKPTSCRVPTCLLVQPCPTSQVR